MDEYRCTCPPELEASNEKCPEHGRAAIAAKVEEITMFNVGRTKILAPDRAAAERHARLMDRTRRGLA